MGVIYPLSNSAILHQETRYWFASVPIASPGAYPNGVHSNRRALIIRFESQASQILNTKTTNSLPCWAIVFQLGMFQFEGFQLYN